VLSEAVHLAVAGGSQMAVIMHKSYVDAGVSIPEKPGTASLPPIRHWE
jgi:hypothetical protein